jgi:hypothetical protein
MTDWVTPAAFSQSTVAGIGILQKALLNPMAEPDHVVILFELLGGPN